MDILLGSMKPKAMSKCWFIIHLFGAIVLLTACSSSDLKPAISKLESPTTSLLQAISIVDENTTWISGHDATFIRTTNGGESWTPFKHPTGDTLQFRDVHAFNADKVVLMSAGPGPLSRIFIFTAPNQWEENFVMQDSLGFLDCIDFWDDQRGIAYGDAIDNYPYILLTSDGGETWNRADSTNMPKAGEGEGGFAASGTCVTTGENGKAWIATGAGGNARFLITEDYGMSWKSVTSPLIKGEAAGNTSVSFSGNIGVVTGGDLTVTNDYTDNCAFSTDGGESWKLAGQPRTKGAFYGSTITTVNNTIFAFACGPNGIDYTSDFGNTWTTLDTLNYWAVSMKGKTGYASGMSGEILKISLQP
ncbi:MAG: oxidoreductase [Ekhidna sp.]